MTDVPPSRSTLAITSMPPGMKDPGEFEEAADLAAEPVEGRGGAGEGEVHARGQLCLMDRW